MTDKCFTVPWLIHATTDTGDTPVRVQLAADGGLFAAVGGRLVVFHKAELRGDALCLPEVDERSFVLDTAVLATLEDVRRAWVAYAPLSGTSFDARARRAVFVYPSDAESFATQTGWKADSLVLT